MANRPGSLDLLEALKMAQDRYAPEQAGKPPAQPFDLQSTLQGADKAIQQGVFGAVDAIGHEGKRLVDGKFGFDALSQALPQLAQSGPQNLAEALATTRQGGAQWTNQDLQALRDRDNLGKAGGGAMDATWLLPAVPAAKAGVKGVGELIEGPGRAFGRWAGANNNSAVGTFGGLTAATADKTALAKAQQLAKSGAPREQIWNETGWFQGPDKKWRFEIDDNAFQPKPDAMLRKDGAMSDFFSDADAGGAYPDLAAAQTKRTSGGVSFYSPADDSIGFAGRGSQGRGRAGHERQHAIQQREGFASGGSPADMTMRFDDPKIQSQWDSVSRELKDIQDAVDVNDLAKRASRYERRDQFPKSADIRPLSQNEQPFFDRYNQLKDETKDILSRGSLLDTNEAYRRLAGEVEARNVQKRMKMTPDERRAAPPWATQDVPDEKQIVSFDSRVSLGKDGEKPLLSALMDAMRGRKADDGLLQALTKGDQAAFTQASEQLKSMPTSQVRDIAKSALGYESGAPKGNKEALIEQIRNSYVYERNLDARAKEIDALTSPKLPQQMPSVDPDLRQKLQGIQSALGKEQQLPTSNDAYFQNLERGFTPPTSLDDIFTGGSPRGPRADTGPLDPRQPEGPAFNASTPEVGYDGQGFTGLDAQFTQAKNRNTLLEALAKREQKPLDPDLLSLLAAYGGAAGMGSALWARQAHQPQPGI